MSPLGPALPLGPSHGAWVLFPGPPSGSQKCGQFIKKFVRGQHSTHHLDGLGLHPDLATYLLFKLLDKLPKLSGPKNSRLICNIAYFLILL